MKNEIKDFMENGGRKPDAGSSSAPVKSISFADPPRDDEEC